MNKNQYASAILKKGVVYIFSKAIVDNRAFTFDRCLLVTENISDLENIGASVRQALDVYGRAMTVEEFRTRPDPLLSITKEKTHAKLNRGAGDAAISLVPSESIIEFTPHKAKGRDAFPIMEHVERLPATASDQEIGAALLRVLGYSQEQNS